MFVRILPPEVRRKIAAGEVIESPADVVKELVENSLDAGAGRITVDTSKGGKRRILVRDDGEGIHPDDMEKVFYEGATSKIDSEEDLLNIGSYGFRGEALSSISAVSRVTLTSKHRSSDRGYRVVCEGGVIGKKEPAPIGAGTEVEVRGLFFNQPARLKFLKREEAEARRIREVITRFALARPDVSFFLASNGRKVLDLPTAPEEERIRQIFGTVPQLAQNGIGSIKVRLYFFPSSSGRFYTFVNKRPVSDRNLSSTLKKLLGFKKTGILFLEVPPFMVDFNVHPKKREVRFLRAEEVYRSIEGCVYKPPPKAVSFLSQRKKLPSEEFKVLGQIEDTVIVARIGDYLYFFDQHLLSERINYERLGESSEDVACRVSLKAGEKLSNREMEDLIRQWEGLSNREVCPHGRPIYYRIHLKEIYDRLGRDFHLY